MHLISRVPLARFNGLFSRSDRISDELRSPLRICGCGTNGINHERMW